VRIGYPTSRRSSVAPLLGPVVRHVAQKYAGSVEFDFVGWIPDNLAGLSGVYLHPAITDYNHYLGFKISRSWDIGLAPLLGGLFEACKTNNKYREYGGCRVAGLYSGVSPYAECVVHKQNGYVAENTVDAWISALEALISSPSLRATIIENAFIDVDRNYSQQATARHWVEMARPYANECRVSMAASTPGVGIVQSIRA
jgi:glycosyltransferase involved in cell wall biosynthesis